MSKKVFIVLGNGFTIDLINHVELKDKIHVTNLFKSGEKVLWPGDGKSGFLSFKYCPNLWNLGARPYMESNDAIQLIEDIITCANILQKENNRGEPNIYIKAYKELSYYLTSLFIYYDKIFDISSVKIDNWGWYKYFDSLYKDMAIDKVYITTFNYDIWLERILKKINIPFNVGGFEEDNSKFHLLKPHGSISFNHNVRKIREAFDFDYTSDSNDGDSSEFVIKYENLDGLNKINAIIPPAGDSNRLDFKWAQGIRERAREIAGNLTESDELIMCGLSYWHVDRLEIDSILKLITPNLDNVKVINPYPPKVLNAVMTTLFKNVIFYTDSNNLID